ncbi:replication endonuclease [Sodalis glossinidius]|uniref:replication endonuclease n=1 Tax=Sodalis glossinidius TaxID=63612 RepID=UPI00159C7173|nr:replication endonuclease [Sodalis glossinidius]
MRLTELRREDTLLAKKQVDDQLETVSSSIYWRFDQREKQKGFDSARRWLTESVVKVMLPRIARVNAGYRLNEIADDDFRALFGDRATQSPQHNGVVAFLRLRTQRQRLPDLDSHALKSLANDAAHVAATEVARLTHAQCDKSEWRIVYDHLAHIVHLLGLQPPLWRKLEKCFVPFDAQPAIRRMCDARWWLNSLRRTANEWRKCMALEDGEGNRISLMDGYAASQANPAIRHTELMVRLRGYEDIANEQGYIGAFVTVTAPSSHHATLENGRVNRKWNGDSPADTQRYLNGVWTCARAKCHRQKRRFFGMRVAEPHHDGAVEIYSSGFHTCEYPLDVFNYDEPANHRFAEVEVFGDIAHGARGSKLASSTITIKKALSLHQMVGRAVECIASKIDKSAERTIVEGDGSAATNTGHRSTADVSGIGSVAASLGAQGKAKAAEGSAIVLCYRNDEGDIIHIRASKIGDNGVKPDTWYVLNANGEFEEAGD